MSTLKRRLDRSAAMCTRTLESELFGHERGALTGALSAKPDQIELAAGGVLFLDAISERSPTAQAKFPRVPQSAHLMRGFSQIPRTHSFAQAGA